MSAGAEENRRFFIVTVGRTGSSLLGGVLSDAGADFGIDPVSSWDPAGGAYEHPSLDAIVRHFEHMDELGPRRPHGVLKRLPWSLRRHRAKAGLKGLLPKTPFLKGDIDRLVHWSARLGYPPTVIVSYRRFGEVLRSLGHLHPQAPNHHAERYETVLRNGLALLSTYGGCAIDYRELTDEGETAWAGALAKATGLDETALLAARDGRLNGPRATTEQVIEPFPSCEDVYQRLRQCKGLHQAPSKAALRAMEGGEKARDR